ncbi:MAG: c-type cytochrome domain-containing protein, partial [Rubripirellula sp.]
MPIELTMFLVAALSCLFMSPAKADESVAEKISTEDLAFFEKEVRPRLVKRCFECHGGSEAEGGLSLASAEGWKHGGDSGPAIVPGKPSESFLIEAINYESWEMPPADRGGKLPDEEIAILTKWVEMGAPDPRTGSEVLGGMTLDEAKNWWAFQPLTDVAPAEFREDVRRIDDLLLKEIESRGLELAPAADRRTLLRRLTYDLTGLPPTNEEVEAFVADQSP